MKLNLSSKDNMKSLSTPQVFKFKTNATKVTINFKIDQQVHGFFPHVGIVAQEGIMVLYRKEDDESWLNVEALTNRQSNTILMHHLVDGKEVYEILIYGPILSRITQMEIEVPDENTLYVDEDEYTQEIFVLGGSISFGIGCTTQAFTLSAILGRKLDASIDTLTFNKADYLKDIYEFYDKNDVKKRYDIGIIEVDYVNQQDSMTKQYLKDIIESMKLHCNNIICWYCIPKYKSHKKDNINDLLSDTDDIILIDCSYLYDERYADICTYSGNFINDSGNMIIFKKFEEIIIDEIIFKTLLGSG